MCFNLKEAVIARFSLVHLFNKGVIAALEHSQSLKKINCENAKQTKIIVSILVIFIEVMHYCVPLLDDDLKNGSADNSVSRSTISV